MRRTVIYCLAAVLLCSCIAENPINSYRHSYKDKSEYEGSTDGGNLFGGGEGTEDSPYILKTAEHVMSMSKALISDDMVYFRLDADVDLSGRAWMPLNSKSPYSYFIGFDGNGHTIRNLSCKNQSYASMFGVLCGYVRNLGIVDAEIVSSGGAGIIGGYVGLQSPADASHVGKVEGCYVSGTVSGTYAGGICGRLGASYGSEACSIVNSWSAADVTATTKEAGGLAGMVYKNASISRSCSRGTVSTSAASGSASWAGGIAANLADVSATVKECVSWNFKVESGTGQTYKVATGGVQEDNIAWKKMNGSFVPEGGSTDRLGYQIIESVSAWGSPWTVKDGNLLLEWQGESAPQISVPESWTDPNPAESDTEPGETPTPEPGENPEGKGTEAEPYKILTAKHLQALAELLSGSESTYAVLEADIDLDGIAWTPLCPAGSTKVLHLDGNGHTISNLNCEGATYASLLGLLSGSVRDLTLDGAVVSGAERVGALCGQLSRDAIISGCTASGVSVTGSKNVGGLVGVCYGDITGSSVQGTAASTVTDTSPEVHIGGLTGYLQYGKLLGCSAGVDITTTVRDVGGLVGYITGEVSVERCSATGGVSTTGNRHIGGLVGHIADAAGSISDCCATGNVLGGNYAGGLIGNYASGSVEIIRCYASGDITGTQSGIGGLIGFALVQTVNMSSCAAWNGSVTGTTNASNWSTGAVVGVAHPKCTLKDNYRKPSMSLTAVWVPESSYSHPDVSADTPLVDSEGSQMSDSSPAKGQTHYPLYPYHGKVAASSTLSELAQTVLGWPESAWDFSGEMPVLKSVE